MSSSAHERLYAIGQIMQVCESVHPFMLDMAILDELVMKNV